MLMEIELNKADVENFVGVENLELYVETLTGLLEKDGYEVNLEWTTGYDRFTVDGDDVRNDEAHDTNVRYALQQMENLNSWLH